MTQDYDKRVTAARPDLAARKYEGILPSTRYVDGTQMQVRHPRTAMKSRPDRDASYTSELLSGEVFTVYDSADGWAWGQAAHDDYVGYVEVQSLIPLAPKTHRVTAVSSHIYPGPDLKLPPIAAIYGGSLMRLKETDPVNGFRELTDGGWIYERHIAPISQYASDFVAEAERFLHAPYQWGGRTVAGIDCSGLVQMALAQCGISIPRDSDQQLKSLTTEAPIPSPRARGDIVFFPGHVGIMVNSHDLLHANATHMAVTIDRLQEVIEIVAKQTDEPAISGVRTIHPG